MNKVRLEIRTTVPDTGDALNYVVNFEDLNTISPQLALDLAYAMREGLTINGYNTSIVVGQDVLIP